MRRRADVDEGGDPSVGRGVLRGVAQVLQVAGVALAFVAWAIARGRFEGVPAWMDMALAATGIVALAVGSWLYPRGLRTLEPKRDD